MINIENLKPKALHNAVMVLPQEIDELEGQIIVPEIEGKITIGLVVSVGEGIKTLSGDIYPPAVKVGDIVLVPPMGFQKFEFKDETYYIGKENELLGILE